MFWTSWPCAVTTSGASVASEAISPGRDEEVRVDDVRPVPARGGAGVAQEAGVAAPAAGATVDHGEVELVAPLAQREPEPLDEDAEVGVGRARVHLGDQEDPHPGERL